MNELMLRRRVCGVNKKGLPYGAVDMGLPSGTLWAQGNIVKDAQGNYAIGEPTDYGCYFSWGNIDGHNAGDGYYFNFRNYVLTPGNQLSGNIPSDDALHDAAVANIGDGWYMPTKDNIEELYNNCSSSWTDSYNSTGVPGRVFTALNGNTLFFPASGYNENGAIPRYRVRGFYWSTTPYNTQGYMLFFTNDTIEPDHLDNRYGGLTIRPVHNSI